MTQQRLAGCGPELNPELGQLHTPKELAEKMAMMAFREVNGITNASILEPSAGGGNLIAALLGAWGPMKIHAVEIDKEWAKATLYRFLGYPVSVTCRDFMLLEPSGKRYNIAVMNPPLDDGVGPTHIAHALEFAPCAISVLRTNDLHGVEHHKKLWSKVHLDRLVLPKRRPIFLGGGGRQNFCIVQVSFDHSDKTIVEWW